MDGQLRIQVSEGGADAERLDALTGYLRRDLLELDVADVTALPAGAPPPGSRAIDPVTVGGLMVSLGSSADGLRAVVTAIRSWLSRGAGPKRTVRLELGGDALELSEASAADQERLIGLFISRHSGSPAEEQPPAGQPPAERQPGGRPAVGPSAGGPSAVGPSAVDQPAGDLPPPP
jgi:hypothetical protein